MGRKIICDSCGTIYPFEKIKDVKVCPVCNVPFDDDSSDRMESPDKDSGHGQAAEKKTYYYYKEGGGTLTDTLSSKFKPLYTFQAIDVEDAKRQLKEVCPNSPLLKTAPSKQIRCPRCLSVQFQLVPRKFSLLTGFATNKFDRMCVMCKKRF